MATYRVDSFHIALGVVGDSAIHLLVKEPTEVVWAMLVDGGTGGGELKIQETMSWIERSNRYDIYQKAPANLQFDAVVITHWDKDHWSGVMNLIKNAYESQSAQERKLPFFKYDNTNAEDPLTILYCPEEGFIMKTSSKFSPKPKDAVAVKVDFVFGKSGNSRKNTCLMRMEPKKASTQSTILGTNLITGLDTPIDKVQNLPDPSSLLSANPVNLGQPGIYIIGVSARVFGPKPKNLAEESSVYIPIPDGLRFVDENKPGTPTNKSSIACMIIWDAAPSPRLSHYFAGDMHWQEEESLVTWTKTSGNRSTVGQSVSSMKLSHHGAKSSTPTAMIKKFDPYNLIASVAERNGHPSWEFLFYVEGWITSGDAQRAAYPPVLSTQFPYYLAKWRDTTNESITDWIALPGGPSNQMSMKILDGSDKSGPAVQYKKDIESIYAPAGVNTLNQTGRILSDPFGDWTIAKLNNKTGKPLDPKSWARDRIAASWKRLSPVPAYFHPGTGVVRSSTNFRLTRSLNMISFFIIESVNDSTKDGGAFMIRGSSQPERLRPVPNFVPPTPSNIVFPNSASLGDQTNMSFFNQPFSNINPLNNKRMATADISSVEVITKKLRTSNNSAYSPASGTNPNENDSLIETEDEGDNGNTDDTHDDDSDGGKTPPIIDPLPDPSLPIQPLPKDQLTDLKPPFFFVCSSDLRYGNQLPPSDTVKQLTSTHPLNNFLSTFHLKGLILARSPDPKKEDQVILHDQDEFLAWLRTSLVLAGKKSPSIPQTLNSSETVEFTAFTNTQTSGYFTDFTLTFPMINKSLKYSSKATAIQLRLPATLFGPGSTVPWENSLILGLETPEAYQSLTLATILKPATDRGADLGLLDIFRILIGDNTFHVDTDPMGSTRNAIWFEPMRAYNTVVRTQYAADSSLLLALNKWQSLANFSIDTFTLVTKLESSWIPTSKSLAALNNWEVLIKTTCTITYGNNATAHPMVLFDFRSKSLTITLQFNEPPDMGGILAWVAQQVPGAKFDFQDWFNKATTQNFKLPIFRRLVLIVELGNDGGFPKALTSLSIDLEVGVLFGKRDGQQEDVVFLFTYDWSQADGSSLQGTLWCPPPDEPDVDRRLLPSYESSMQFEPVTVTPSAPWAGSLDLSNLIPNGSGGKIINIPDGIPSEVTMAVLAIDRDKIYFEAKLECTEPDPSKAGGFPTIFLSRIGLNANYVFSTKAFAVGFDFGVTMFPQKGSRIIPIELTGAVNYDNGAWSASATVESPHMQGAHLLDYFDSDTKSDAAALIQHIQLLFLSLDYQYSKSTGSSFKFRGSLGVGNLELDINFDYISGQPWMFTATIDTSTGIVSTVQDILDSIVGDGSVNLPSCVADIKVGSTSGVADPLFKLTLQGLKTNSAGGKDGKDVISSLEVNIGTVSFVFLQYRNSSWNVNKNSSKRILRLQVHNLPDFDIPVVGTIPLSQTIQEICFMWIQDGSKTNVDGQPPGLTKKEIENLNDLPVFNTAPIYYKTTKKTHEDTDVLIEAGCHFVIVTKDSKGTTNVVMDYVFLKPSSTDKVSPPAEALRIHAEAKRRYGPDTTIRSKRMDGAVQRTSTSVHLSKTHSDVPPDANAGSSTQKTAFKVSIGPLAISNVGIKFSNSIFSLCFDASIAVGPIAMTLQGFSIDFDFGHGHDLQHNFPTRGNGVGLSLRGFIIAFDRPPLDVGGGLIEQPTENEDDTYWAGGVDIKFKAWSFLAAGAYGSLMDPKKDKFTTTFVFAQLYGPLVNLSYASITGLTGGFGYNNSITLPAIADVPKFPFLTVPKVPDPSPTGNPTMDMLVTLLGGQWFTPQNGSFWVAAGLTVTAFQMLQVTAVAAIQWDPDVKAGIYAVAIADIPSTAAPFKIAHIELGIAATVDFGKGIAAFEAQLAPSSFILDPACHLTGGFALYYWFKGTSGQQAGSPGDWVFTIGGYHAAYKPPAQYPKPPRLQIRWSLGPLSITGQAYFAITPVACMAGGSLHASLNIGVLSAWLDAFADFIINYSPFSFKAVGGISVGVRYTLDLLFVTLHINIEISATLTLMGPPFQGSVYVDFWVFGFTVNFGTQSPPAINKATLEEFYNLVLQKDSPTAQATKPTPHKFTCVSGLIPSTPPNKATMARKRARLQKILKALDHQGKVRRNKQNESDEGGDPESEIENQIGIIEAGLDNSNEPPMWEVQAGTFTFNISSVFAISDVTVNADDANPVHLPDPRPNTANIYSRPMYLTAKDKPLESELVVTITAATPTKKDELRDGPNPWAVRALVDQMPRALWDAYDRDADPNYGSKDLLNNPDNPTVALIMSILLIPPEPRLSKDNIPAFDAVASLPQEVFPTPPDFPRYTDKANAAWRPVPPTPPPPTDPALPWENVQRAWKRPGLCEGAAAVMAAAWNKCMGWDTQSASLARTESRRAKMITGTKVLGTVPKRLVDGLQNLYVAAPMIAAT